MFFDVITIFPGFFTSILEHGLLKRAMASGHAVIRLHDLREFTDDKHHTVDDRPFGGGPGMLFKPEPLFRAVESVQNGDRARKTRVVLLSPQGRLLTQSVAEELSQPERLILICGRYEGVDERVTENLVTDEISIGDFVLSGGELPAAVLMEATIRLLPGVLGNEESAQQDSFAIPSAASVEARHGLLDCPHYTRPAEFRDWKVPEILLSGDHTKIREWRRQRALEKTFRRRPDLLAQVELSKDDRKWLEALESADKTPSRA
jgi:tRNA (guanine37-N1)-methyltransferase